MNDADKWFVRGLALAAAYAADENDDVLACEILTQHNYEWEDLIKAGVPEYDLRRLAKGIGRSGMNDLSYKRRSEIVVAQDMPTSTLIWKRYDGTPETLPEMWRNVLLIRDGRVNLSVYWIDACPAWDGYDNPECHYYPPQVGDLWAYWPVAPEVSHA